MAGLADQKTSSSGNNPSITRSDKFWLENGNVILIADNTGFLVDTTLLSLHSDVFGDMFKSVQSPNPANNVESYEGHPIVRVSDSASDICFILDLIYSGGGSVRSGSVKVDITGYEVVRMLRLGRKYKIHQIYEEAVRRLKIWFPTTLDRWDEEVKRNRARSTSTRPDWLTPVNVIRFYKAARTYDLDFVLPIAAMFCTLLDPRQLIFGVTEDGNKEELSPNDQAIILQLKEELISFLFRYTNSLFRFMDYTKGSVHETTTACAGGVTWLTNSLLVLRPQSGSNVDDPLSQSKLICDNLEDSPGPCASCVNLLAPFCGRAREDLWEHLNKSLQMIMSRKQNSGLNIEG
ncbi:hypothetical protein C8Q75DRAFT_806498 [Abortiporus biennis]|nr:hypothetical protein C8Q75DRAFT_806498 [Abortiporus biennis]